MTAFADEIRGYLDRHDFQQIEEEAGLRLYKSDALKDVVVVQGAIGKEQAEAATEKLIESFRPQRIVSAGFAAGARPGYRAGAVFLCDRLMVVEGAAAFWNLDSAAEQLIGGLDEVGVFLGQNDDEQKVRQNVSFGGCLTVPQIVSSSSMKNWIGERFPVSVIDMESFWVSATAEKHGISRTVVRVVFDPADQNLPDFISQSAEEHEATSVGRAIRYILSRPTETPRLLQLKNQASVARQALSTFLTAITMPQSP